jgi:hypothetical protein
MNRARAFRFLRIGWSVGCGILCLLMTVLWVRSYSAFDRVSGRVGARNSLIFVSYAGRLSAVYTPVGVPWKLPSRDSGPILPNDVALVEKERLGLKWANTDVVWPEHTIMGAGWIYRKLYINIPNGETGWHPQGLSGRSYASYGTSGLIIPNWLIVCSLVSVGWLPWPRWRFSLRTLLIVMTVVAVAIVVIVALSR